MTKIFALIIALTSASASAGSCQDVYECKSASGRYQISLSHCYDNDLGGNHALDPVNDKGFLLIDNGQKINDAGLSASWDGDTMLSFELSLASEGETQQLLSAELNKKTLKGTIRFKTREFEPGPFKTVRSEAISCKDE
jgi:hypothetical protein